MRVLVVNAGSSSLKLRLLGDADELLERRDIDAPRGAADAGELADALASLGAADAVGHRVVHGGARFRGAVRVEPGVRRALEDLTDLAPLHQPKSLAALEAVGRALPGVPAVACFDTAFHATLPEAASTYAIPRDWRERFGARRYGFHGLSHAYASRRAAAMLGAAPESLRMVTCHLGAGASVTAVRDGVSVDTTMGFTPLEGLAMATRSGSVDPGLVLWLARREGIDPAELEEALEHRSGLAGLAGTPDMREVLARAGAGDDAAALGLAVYVHRLRAGIAAMAAAAGGLDALVFTGGVGENSAEVRARGAAGLAFLGVAVDEGRNAAATGDALVGAAGAKVQTVVVSAREDLEIAREVRAVMGAAAL